MLASASASEMAPSQKWIWASHAWGWYGLTKDFGKYGAADDIVQTDACAGLSGFPLLFLASTLALSSPALHLLSFQLSNS